MPARNHYTAVVAIQCSHQPHTASVSPLRSLADDMNNGSKLNGHIGGTDEDPEPPAISSRFQTFGPICSDCEMRQPKPRHPLLGLLRLNQAFGLFPACLSSTVRFAQGHKAGAIRSLSLCALAVKAWSLLLIMGNGYLIHENLSVYNDILEDTHRLHPYTMMSLITMLLPVQNLLNMVIFWLLQEKHQKMLLSVKKCVDSGDEAFQDRLFLNRSFRWLLLYLAVILGVPMITRIVQLICVPDLLHEWFGLPSLLIVPMLRGIQCLPLLYFSFLCKLLVHLHKSLRRRIPPADTLIDSQTVEAILDRYFKINLISRKMSNFFSWFTFISMMLAVFQLCVSVYFITHTTESIDVIQFSRDLPTKIDTTINVFWGFGQVFIALIYAFLLCKSGWLANEALNKFLAYVYSYITQDRKARVVAATVVRSTPIDENARFQIIRFNQCLSSQVMWGVSIWKAFLIERSFFFTVCTTIASYALILIRFRTSSDEAKGGKQSLADCLAKANLTAVCGCLDTTGLTEVPVCEKFD